jgi:hypothetical protein
MAVFHVSLLYLQDSTQDGTLGGLLLCISPQKLRISSVRKSHRTLQIYRFITAGCPAQRRSTLKFWRRAPASCSEEASYRREGELAIYNFKEPSLSAKVPYLPGFF